MRFDVPRLSDEALAAAAAFHGEVLGEVEAAMADAACLTLVFADAPRDHRGWRLAMVQGLARQYAPIRVNAIAGGDAQSCGRILGWLDQAGAITGQLLELDPTA